MNFPENFEIHFARGKLDENTLEYIIKNKILIFNAEHIQSILHFKAALFNAERSFKRNENISKELSLEIMLYLSGVRQIDKAKQLYGVNLKTSQFLIFSRDLNIVKKLNLSIIKKEEICDDLVFERMALLNIKK